MKLNENWEIRKGPTGNDLMLVEKRQYFSDKFKEYRTSETPRYYPNMETLVKRLVEIESIDVVALENAQDVLKKLDEVKKEILENLQK